ncbi:MAG: ribosome silencing factor [Candidatus Riflebacteria bacterium]|nr:ribosome silencing factor [Candidatus Riflebacteria bacterium]
MNSVKNDFPETLKNTLSILNEKKIENLTILDVREVVSYTDYLIIGTGMNTPHIQTLADIVAAELKKDFGKSPGVEGYRDANWILIDGLDYIVHLFLPKAREFYALEELWGDAKVISI